MKNHPSRYLTVSQIVLASQKDFDKVVEFILDKVRKIDLSDYLPITYKAVYHVDLPTDYSIACYLGSNGQGAEIARQKIELAIKNYFN